MTREEATAFVERLRDGSFEKGRDLVDFMRIVAMRIRKYDGATVRWDDPVTFVEDVRPYGLLSEK